MENVFLFQEGKLFPAVVEKEASVPKWHYLDGVVLKMDKLKVFWVDYNFEFVAKIESSDYQSGDVFILIENISGFLDLVFQLSRNKKLKVSRNNKKIKAQIVRQQIENTKCYKINGKHIKRIKKKYYPQKRTIKEVYDPRIKDPRIKNRLLYYITQIDNNHYEVYIILRYSTFWDSFDRSYSINFFKEKELQLFQQKLDAFFNFLEA